MQDREDCAKSVSPIARIRISVADHRGGRHDAGLEHIHIAWLDEYCSLVVARGLGKTTDCREDYRQPAAHGDVKGPTARRSPVWKNHDVGVSECCLSHLIVHVLINEANAVAVRACSYELGRLRAAIPCLADDGKPETLRLCFGQAIEYCKQVLKPLVRANQAEEENIHCCGPRRLGNDGNSRIGPVTCASSANVLIVGAMRGDGHARTLRKECRPDLPRVSVRVSQTALAKTQHQAQAPFAVVAREREPGLARILHLVYLKNDAGTKHARSKGQHDVGMQDSCS